MRVMAAGSRRRAPTNSAVVRPTRPSFSCFLPVPSIAATSFQVKRGDLTDRVPAALVLSYRVDQVCAILRGSGVQPCGASREFSSARGFRAVWFKKEGLRLRLSLWGICVGSGRGGLRTATAAGVVARHGGSENPTCLAGDGTPPSATSPARPRYRDAKFRAVTSRTVTELSRLLRSQRLTPDNWLTWLS
jgi:hypothetical protein